MGQNFNKRFTVNLEIDTKTAEKQVKATVGNLREILADIGKESSKMEVFRELSDYLRQVDDQLSALKQKHGDKLFNEIFGNLDGNLLKEIEKVFGVAKSEITQLEQLKERVAKARANKESVSDFEIQELEQLTRSLYEAIGRKGEAKLSGRGKIETRLSSLETSLNNFAVVWEDVNDRVSQGFSLDKTSDYIERAKQKIKEINELKTVINNEMSGGNLKEEDISGYISKVSELSTEFKNLAKLAGMSEDEIKNVDSTISSLDQSLNDSLTKALNRSGKNPIVAFYDESTKAVKSAIDEIAKLDKQFASAGTAGIQMNAFDKTNPADLQREYIVEAFREYKKNQESVNKISISDASEKDIELLEKQLRLIQVIQKARIKGASSQDYGNIYGLEGQELSGFYSLLNDKTYTKYIDGSFDKLRKAISERRAKLVAEIERDNKDIANSMMQNEDTWKQFVDSKGDSLFSSDKVKANINRDLEEKAAKNVEEQKRISELKSQFDNSIKEFIDTGLIDVTGNEQKAYSDILDLIRKNTVTTVEECKAKFAELAKLDYDELSKKREELKTQQAAPSEAGKSNEVADQIKNEAKAAKMSLKDLNDTKNEYQSVIDSLSKRKKIKTKVTKQNDAATLKASLKEMQDAFANFAMQKDGTEEKLDAYGKLIRAAKEYQGVVDYIRSKGSAKAQGLLVSKDMSGAYNDVTKLLDGLDEKKIKQIKTHFQNKINNINKDIASMVVTGSDKTTGGASDKIAQTGVEAKKASTEVNKLIDSFVQAISGFEQLGNVKPGADLDDAYTKVLNGIKDGTYKTVDEAVAKFKELSSVIKAVGGNVNGSVTGKTRTEKKSQVIGTSDVSSGVISSEVKDLETLKLKLVEVRNAVDAKTRAFEEGYVTADAAVDAEIVSLNELLNTLRTITTQIDSVVIALNKVNINDMKQGLADATRDMLRNAEKIQKAEITPNDLDEMPKKIDDLTDSFVNALRKMDDLDDIKLGANIDDAYTKVLENIRNGTFKTVDECVAKFKELTFVGEIGDLERLNSELVSVKHAVDAKTEAFKNEAMVVGNAVGNEITALTKLRKLLEEIQSILLTVFSASKGNFGDIEISNGKENVDKVSSAIQNIQKALNQILGVLQGFTGIESDGKNSIKHKEPAVDNTTDSNKENEHVAEKLGDLATEKTVRSLRRFLSGIENNTRNNKNSEIDDMKNVIDSLVNAITANIKSLKDVTDNVIQYKKDEDERRNRKNISTDEQTKQASNIIGRNTDNTNVRITATGDQAVTTTKKVGSEIAKIVETTNNGITSTTVTMSNAYKVAMQKAKKEFEEFNKKQYFGIAATNGIDTDAQKTYSSYLKIYNDLENAIAEYDIAMKSGKDTSGIQQKINTLQTALGGLSERLTQIANKSRAFMQDGTVFANLDGNEIKSSADNLKKLVVSTESLAVAFRGVHNDGRKVVYDVLDNGVIKSYAVELDEATGAVKKMELSEYGLVNAMQKVNDVAKRDKELDNLLSFDGTINKDAAIFKNYSKLKQDLNDVVNEAWNDAKNNGGVIDESSLNIINGIAQEVIRLGNVIQSEYSKISKLRNSGGAFESLGTFTGETEERMHKYMQEYAHKDSKSLLGVQYDPIAKTMTAELVDLSGNITKVQSKYNELFDGIQILSKKGARSIDETTKEINSLKSSLNNVAGFIDQNSQAAQKYNAALINLSTVTEKLNNGTLSFNDDNIKWWNQLRQAVISTGKELLTVANNNKTELVSGKTKQTGIFNKYKKDIKDAEYLTEDMKADLTALEKLLKNVNNSADLTNWVKQFEELKANIDAAKEAYGLDAVSRREKKAGSDAQLNQLKKDADKAYNSLKIDPLDNSDDVKKIKEQYDNLIEQLAKYKAKKQALTDEELNGLREIYNQLRINAQEYAKQHPKDKTTYGAGVMNSTANKYSRLSELANVGGLMQSSNVLKDAMDRYEASFKDLQTKHAYLNANPIKENEEAFKKASAECNALGREVDNLLKKYNKLHNDPNKIGENPLSDFVDNKENRINALNNYVKATYKDSEVEIIGFKNAWHDLIYTIKNGDGTVTQAKASIDNLGTAIVETAGNTSKSVGKLGSYFSGIGEKLRSISQYLISMFGIQEVIQRIRQGITYVIEIDTALTDLKKVTNETSVEYDAFLQKMSKTASVVGSTVAELTTMASEWARLGYSMEEAGKLAESTAILLNVSEFEDATTASEALISTMQAFQYTADESQHVVDILNEVGNNYAVSSDGIATALQDSASALMEAGNNLEQSVALVAAANKVVQDPNSVGSALRTISLRLRGTSVEILEEMGEETDGVVESISKMQEKIKALTGVDILTEAGAYKDTYTILKDIAGVWDEMSNMDQAAALELMAGKNRANTLAAILNNMEDLEGAYKSALNAEGSAIAENETYLDSIQGRVDIFKNSVQTMWMNFIDSDVAKFIVDLGTALINLVDNFGLLGTLAGTLLPLKAVFGEIKQSFKDINKDNAYQIFGKHAESAKEAASAIEEVVDAAEQQVNVSEESSKAQQKEANETLGTVAAEKAEAESSRQSATEDIKQKMASDLSGASQKKEAIETNKLTMAQKANIAVTKGLFVLKSIGKGLAIGLAVTAVTNAIFSIINAVKEAAERMRELTETAIHSAQEINDTRESVENYKSEIENLRKVLTDSTTTEQEAYDARAQLIDIQNQLIDKFGLEAQGINLVTGEIKAQIAAIDELTQKSAVDWYGDNQEAYQNAINTIEGTHSNGDFTFFTETGSITTSRDAYGITRTEKNIISQTLGSASQSIRDAYLNGLTSIIEDAGGRVKSSSTAGTAGSITYYNAISSASFENKTVEELDAIFSQMQSFLTQFEAENGVDLSGQIVALEKLRKEYVDEDYKDAKELYDIGRQQEAYAKYGAQYGAILDAQEEFYKATTDENRLASIEQYNQDVKAAFEKAGGEFDEDGSWIIDEDSAQAHMQKYFKEMQDKFKAEEFELNLKLSGDVEDGLKSKLADIIQSGGEYGLAALDNNQINDMISKGLNNNPEYHGGVYTNTYGYTQAQVKGLVELQAEANAAGISIESLITILTNLGLVAGRPVEEVAEGIKAIGLAYSTLSASAEELANISDVVNEAIYDNVEISQEQYDALQSLIGAEEEFADCFDANNKLIVKNSSLLRKLVAQKKQDQKATIQQARSGAQLQYKNTVQQLQQVIKAMALEVKATGLVSAGTLNTIGVLREQLTTLKQTIQQYALLELSLTDAANAYSEFEEAKERDAQLTYGDSMIEMLQTINEGFKTGQVGTEAFQFAVEAIVPESEWKHIDDIEQRMIAIHDYIDKNPLFADWFTIDDGQFSITLDNINNFIDDAFSEGLFTENSSGDFFLTDKAKSLEEFAAELEVTEAVALAMLTELEKYDASWGNIITDLTTTELDRKINDATDALDEALIAQEEFIRSGGDLNSEEYKKLVDNVNSAQTSLNNATKAAELNAQKYNQIETAYAALTGEIALTKDAADSLFKSLGFIDDNGDVTVQIDDDGTIHMTAEQLTALKASADKITSEPTVLDMQLRYDTIYSQIEELQRYIDEKLNFEDSEVAVAFGITNEEEAKAKIAELTAEQETISLNYNITATTAEQSAGTLEKLTTWETNGLSINISGNTEKLQSAVQEANAIEAEDKDIDITADPTQANADIDSVDNNEIEDKKPKILIQGVPVAISQIDSVSDELDKLKDETINISVNKTTYEKTKKWNSRTQTWEASVNGTAHAGGTANANGDWGAKKTEVALTGELGPEMIVRGNRWFTVGDNGAEFTQVKKGDIIFNHKQTKDLLSKGYVAGRGKMKGGDSAFASGTAYYRTFGGYVGDEDVFKNGSDKWMDPWTNTSKAISDAADSISDAASNLSDSSDEFREIFDWIEVRLEEINDSISLKNAKLENAVGSSKQNAIIDDMITLNQALYNNLIAGSDKYYAYAAKLLSKIPSTYREIAKDGTIAIEEFVGKVDEETLNAIQEYREWVQKGDSATQQAEETLAEISNLAKQAIDNIVAEFDNKKSLNDSKIEQLEAYNALLETDKGFESANIYQQMIDANNANIKQLEKQRDKMQEELDAQVEAGNIKKYSQAWYDAVNAISDVDTEIIKLKTDTENWQDAINELHWDKFDALMGRLESVSKEAENLIDILNNKDMVDESGNWTDEGITALGLYAQQMEAAEVQAKKYQEEIDYLNENWQELGYTEEEYLEKLDELKDGQYDAIKAYHDSKDAIVDLNKERIDAIKEGIEKEIEAYEKLIKAKKEELEAEKDLHGFEQSIMEQKKSIADLERQLAALSGDNSASARAKRAQLEAELAKANAELEESYYDRSISNQQEALDKELENFQENKDAEIEGLEEYLENTEQVVADSLATVQANTDAVYQTLQEMGQEYSLSITESLTAPWQEGETAIQSFSEQFGISMSTTVEELQKLELEFLETMAEIERAGIDAVTAVKENAQDYTSANYKSPSSGDNSGGGSNGGSSTAGLVSNLSGNIRYGNKGSNVKKLQQALNELGYGNSGTVGLDGKFGDKTLAAVKKFQKDMGITADGIVGPNTKKKFKLKGYAKGTTGVKEDQWALLHELGDELELAAGPNGKLQYIRRGTSIIPHDISENLMELGQLDPSEVLERNRPAITAPHIINNEISLNITYGDMVSIGEYNGNNLADLEKMVSKQFEKHTKDLNNALRRFTR